MKLAILSHMKALDEYRKSHRHPLNRVLHAFGIPMIVVSFCMVWFWPGVAAILFAVGWILQFVGHWIEGKPPAFLRHPKYLLVGVVWWLKKVKSDPPKVSYPAHRKSQAPEAP